MVLEHYWNETAAFAPEVKGRKKCDFQKDITPFFTWKIEMNTFSMFNAGGIVYDGELDTLLGKGNGHKIMRYCLACRNPERAVESACLYFLNRREYETLMELITLCPFEPFGHFRSIVDLHFLFPNSSNGKDKFNYFYLEHFGKVEPEMWKKHHGTGNLENILLPALKLGASSDWYVYEAENVMISTCPCCHEALSWRDKRLVCTNEKCEAVIKAALLKFGQNLQLKGFGTAAADYLYSIGVRSREEMADKLKYIHDHGFFSLPQPGAAEPVSYRSLSI